MKPSLRQHNWILAIAILLLTIIPLTVVRGSYTGSDSQGQEAIKTLNPTYEPWAHSLFVPPSKEIESLLFAAQAALGAGVIGFVIGLYKGRAIASASTPQPAPSQPSDSRPTHSGPNESSD